MSEKQPTGLIVWTDLTVEDASSLREFYAAVTGWKPEPVAMDKYDDYNMTNPTTGDPVAGICHARGSNAGLNPRKDRIRASRYLSIDADGHSTANAQSIHFGRRAIQMLRPWKIKR